jgi:hypothetical protein
MTQKTNRPAARKPYRKPRLIVHGNLKTLTTAKGGFLNDGGSKPNTRSSGGQS